MNIQAYFQNIQFTKFCSVFLLPKYYIYIAKIEYEFFTPTSVGLYRNLFDEYEKVDNNPSLM